MSADHFERLGLPRRFSVDPDDLERRYLARSREVHPDFHTLGTGAEQRASIEDAAALNEAYQTLRDPFRRAEHLLQVLGGPTPQEEKNLDPGFLLEMMDFRERIEAARAAGGGSDEIERHLSIRLEDVMIRAASHFTSFELHPAADPATRRPDLIVVRRLLNAAKTIQSLLQDVRDS